MLEMGGPAVDLPGDQIFAGTVATQAIQVDPAALLLDLRMRTGRWALCGKTECGIHRATWARN